MIGYQGRLNGPVDNKISSCTSCHGTAEFPAGTMVPPNGANPAPWFRNIPSGASFDPDRQSLDYSLQIAVGLSNVHAAQELRHAPSPGAFEAVASRIRQTDTRPPRDGGPLH